MGAAMRSTHGDLFASFLLLASAFLAMVSALVRAGPDDIAAATCPGTGASNGRLACLAKSYAPLLKFDSGEAFFPSSVDDFLPFMKLINADGSDVPNQPRRLRSSNLVYMSTTPLTTFLTTKKPLNETEIDRRFMLGRKPGSTVVPIYTSIVRKEVGVLYDFVYYAFYPYNQGKLVANRVFGNHVGDWEHATLRISFENSRNQPRLLQAFTSQHSGGECLTPSNVTFVVNTPHPIFYVARGSHGTYNKPGRTVYLQIPELEIELADDHDGANAVEWATWKNVAVRIEGQPLAKEYRWWGYNGRWGNRQGPTTDLGQFILENGPAYPGVHTLTFQLDLPAFENCPVL